MSRDQILSRTVKNTNRLRTMLIVIGLATITSFGLISFLNRSVGHVKAAGLEPSQPVHVSQSISATLNLVGQLGGKSIAVAVQGNYAYLGVGPRMVIFNISNPAAPIKVGQTNVLTDFVNTLIVSGSYAYLTPNGANSQVLIFNVSVPTLPVQVGSTAFASSQTINALRLAGNSLYIGTNQGLSLFDVSNPAAPTQTGNFTLTAVIDDVAIQGHYAYLADYSYHWLRVIDVSIPAALTQTGRITVTGYPSSIVVSGSYAYLGSWSAGLHILNISNPLSPTHVSVINPPVYPNHVILSGTLVYVAADNLGLEAIDVSNPVSPTLLGTYDTPNRAYALDRSGHNVFVADVRGLQIVNVSNSISPTLSGVYDAPSNVSDLVANGHYDYETDVNDQLRVIDVNDPANPQEVNVISVGQPSEAVIAPDGKLYVANMLGTLHVFNISNPITPTQFASVTVPFQPEWVAASNLGDVYSLDYIVSFHVISVTNPASPTLMGSLPATGAEGKALVVSGTYAYIGQYAIGLRIADVSNPISPTIVGGGVVAYIQDMTMKGNNLYLTSNSPTPYLRVVDVSNPVSPTLIGSLPFTGTSLGGITIKNNTAYIGSGRGIQLVDISSPAVPSLLATYPMSATALHFAWHGVYLDAAVGSASGFSPDNGYDGLYIFQTGEVSVTTLSASNDSPTTLGHITNFTASVSANGVSYTWNFGDGSVHSPSSNGAATHTYTSTGYYTARITATNSISTWIATTPVSITNLSPIANAGANQIAVPNATVNLTGTASTDPDGHLPLMYRWQQIGGTVVTLTNSTLSIATFTTPSSSGVLTFTLTVTDATGLVSSTPSTTSVSIKDTAITNLSASNSSPTSLGHSTDFNATAIGSNLLYQWNFGDGNLSSASSSPTATHTYGGIGNYTVRVTATNSISMAWTTTPVSITASVVSISGLIASNSSPTLIRHSTTLSATISTGTDVTYTWNFGDNTALGFGKTILHTYLTWGSFTATVTATNSISTAMTTTPIEIVPLRVYLPLVLK